MERCRRCNAEPGAGRWCARCGLDLRPGETTLPTPEALDAARRESEWLARLGDPSEAEAADAPAFGRAPPPRLAYEPQRSYSPPPYRPLGRRARLATYWIGLVTALSVAVAGVEIAYAVTLADAQADATPLASALDLVLIVQFSALALAAAAFIAWLWRAHGNVEALGLARRHGRAWAIAGWFIPLMNLFRPCQVVNDAWHAGEPDPARMRPDRPLAPLVTAWWAAWLLSEVLARLSVTTQLGAYSRDELRSAATLAVAGDAFVIVAGILALAVVSRVSARQEACAAARATAGRPLVPAPAAHAP